MHLCFWIIGLTVESDWVETSVVTIISLKSLFGYSIVPIGCIYNAKTLYIPTYAGDLYHI